MWIQSYLSWDHLVSFLGSGAQQRDRNFALLHNFQPITVRQSELPSWALIYWNISKKPKFMSCRLFVSVRQITGRTLVIFLKEKQKVERLYNGKKADVLSFNIQFVFCMKWDYDFFSKEIIFQFQNYSKSFIKNSLLDSNLDTTSFH